MSGIGDREDEDDPARKLCPDADVFRDCVFEVRELFAHVKISLRLWL